MWSEGLWRNKGGTEEGYKEGSTEKSTKKEIAWKAIIQSKLSALGRRALQLAISTIIKQFNFPFPD